MVEISRITCERKGIERIVDINGILRLNETHIWEGLHHKMFWETTAKYRKHRYELLKEPTKQVNRIFIDQKLEVKVVIDSRTTLAHKVRTRLQLKQHDVISTK